MTRPKPTTYSAGGSNARPAKGARLEQSQRLVETGSPDQPATESLANHRDEPTVLLSAKR